MSSASNFVYVNHDGTARELSTDEREYLLGTFKPGDGNRPYIKADYNTRDGWGSLSGFLPRHKLPPSCTVQPINPQYDKPAAITPDQIIADHMAAGDTVKRKADGSIVIQLSQGQARQQSLEIMRRLQLERQKEREALARHPDYH